MSRTPDKGFKANPVIPLIPPTINPVTPFYYAPFRGCEITPFTPLSIPLYKLYPPAINP